MTHDMLLKLFRRIHWFGPKGLQILGYNIVVRFFPYITYNSHELNYIILSGISNYEDQHFPKNSKAAAL